MSSVPIRRALITVSDKLGLAGFADGLTRAGVQIFSTGGTAHFLQQHEIPVHELSGYTGFPEMMGGRLKTLHPKVFGGILARRDHPDDLKALDDFNIQPFELVVVNLYPFQATVARDEVTVTEAIEQIDIGGPSLVRAAAKNHAFVTVVTSPDQYAETLEVIARDGCTPLDLRQRLAVAAFAHTAAYDRAICAYLGRQLHVLEDRFPSEMHVELSRKATLRYGENPHQQAALYRLPVRKATLVDARQLHGKELSYNNWLDLDSALALVRDLPDAGAAVIKHNNPCGAASALQLAEATRNALAGDPLSAFGSIVALNQIVDRQTAEVLTEPDRFIEAIIAPAYAADAIDVLTTRPKWKASVRILETGPYEPINRRLAFRQIDGGMLVQDEDLPDTDRTNWQVMTDKVPDDAMMDELAFAWTVVRHVKSNAITVTGQRTLWGVGAGQMSRVDSVQIALGKAGHRARGAALASDAFFPFADSIERAAQAGIAAIVQPGGSRRDDEVIAACQKHGLAMVFTGRRHFRH